ncbi:methylamine dehydrogenase (amicyanin) small subunit [Indioceanicola profundi]|uniref:methylamine dehydrogenase (amicyanin) small subunit n=1 Tax=Indioceanicola profundi TaxID=2220096 RepID=UPI000E6ADD0B|nr:methylamine dehydrogenase (amicyanin) small subunit [Indioceanicola profundi]
MLFKTRFDALVEGVTRHVAQRTSRRGFLGRIGVIVGGATVLPLLPVDRRGMKQAHATMPDGGWQPQATDAQACDYWRHCSLDGNVCDCCGGTMTQCPPGTSLSPSSWVASCFNPEDKVTYLIAYRDCCGKSFCGRCGCFNTQGELPIYRPEFSNDIIWCFGAEGMTYHCTISPIVGKAA